MYIINAHPPLAMQPAGAQVPVTVGTRITWSGGGCRLGRVRRPVTGLPQSVPGPDHRDSDSGSGPAAEHQLPRRAGCSDIRATCGRGGRRAAPSRCRPRPRAHTTISTGSGHGAVPAPGPVTVPRPPGLPSALASSAEASAVRVVQAGGPAWTAVARRDGRSPWGSPARAATDLSTAQACPGHRSLAASGRRAHKVEILP